MKEFNDTPLVKRKSDLENSIIVTVVLVIVFLACVVGVVAKIIQAIGG